MLMHKDINITTVPKELVNDIMDVMVSDLTKEIDFDIMVEQLSKCGWSRVDLPPFDNRYKVLDIVDWAYHHCQGEFETCGVRYIFEDKRDATLFALKWL
jgi:hypothetical protein